jgi:hypothetical protein
LLREKARASKGEGNRLLSALHTIGTYPPDLSDPVFAQYPAMKFGGRDAVRHFAQALAPAARRLIADSGGRAFVLTSPILQGLPCGANRVCAALHAILVETLPDGVDLRLETLDVRPPVPIHDAIEFEHYNEYSKQDLKTRRALHPDPAPDAACDDARFAARNVVFVNDINVTGTQMRWVSKLPHLARAASLDWLLILNVENDIGCRVPQLESEINASSLAAQDAFTAFLRGSEFDCTGKLVARLLSYDAATLRDIFRGLDAGKRRQLHQGILAEGIYGTALFREKLRAVEAAVG